jgi:predicted nuclease with TOPRIM domain
MPKQKKQDETIEESQQTLEKYRAEIEAMKEKASHYSAEVKAEFDKRLSELETMYSDMQKRYDSLKDKTGEAWEDTKDFVVLTNKALVHSYRYFISHYKKKG